MAQISTNSVLRDIWGPGNVSDATWPYRQNTWQQYKIDNAIYNDGINPPQTLNPQVGRVIRGLNRQPNSGGYTAMYPANVAPLWGIWKDIIYFEYYRRAGSQNGYIDNTPGSGSRTSSQITAYDLNRIRDLVQTNPPTLGTAGYSVLGYATHSRYLDSAGNYVYFAQATGYTAGFSGVSVGTKVYASHINSVIDKLIGANNVCVCNCNYCTCNCNYCTCVCNYACTCNCNYSDERVKTDIKYLRTEQGLKIYSFNYIWDKFNTYEGVVAQDLVETKFAHALSKDSKGFYIVDYSKIPVKMKTIEKAKNGK